MRKIGSKWVIISNNYNMNYKEGNLMAQSSVVAEGCNIMEGLMVTQQMICLVEDSAERR